MRASGITDYHTKYLAAIIKRKPPRDSFQRLLSALYDSDVRLYPHQLAAADFTHRNPIQTGVILADEMGMGKTVEAGISIYRRWMEGYNKILILAPISEIQMWKVNLLMKFGLKVEVLNKEKMNYYRKKKIKRPCDRKGIYLCTHNFAYEEFKRINRVKWDLVVVDQAHRIENIYDIRSEVGDAIRQIVWEKRCILITSNPFQSTMKRLFKIGNLADKYSFGDRRSYNYQFVSITDDIDYPNLASRLRPIMRRAKGRRNEGFVEDLRREEMQVLYTGTPKEVDFVVAVLNYFGSSSKFGLPNDIASLPAYGLFMQMTLSPKLALGGIGIIDSGLKIIRSGRNPSNMLYNGFQEDIEHLDWIDDEWHRNKEKEKLEAAKEKGIKRAVDAERKELMLLREYALEIRTDTRFKELLKAFKRIKQKYGRKKKKIVIYTQSKQAQKYLSFLLNDAGFKGIYHVNEKNDSKENQDIYEKFLKIKSNALLISGDETHDRRAAVIKEFENYGNILIATDKGMQDQILSKCDIVVNYDLPLDPYLTDLRLKKVQGFMNRQNILIVNLVNEQNELEVWNYNKQRDIFDMFNGDFGRSDIPVGSIGVGSDFAMLVFGYYMTHHTIHLVDRAFRKTEIEIKDAKSQSMNAYYRRLIEKTAKQEREESEHYLSLYQKEVLGLKEALMTISSRVLEGKGSVSARGSGSIYLKKKPFRMKKENLGRYSFDEVGTKERRKFYISRGIGKKIVNYAYNKRLTINNLRFRYSSANPRKLTLEKLKGKSGVMNLKLVTIEGMQLEQYLLFCGKTDSGKILTQKQCHDMMRLKATDKGKVRIHTKFTKLYNRNIDLLKDSIIERDEGYIRELSRKMDQWIEDKVLVHKKDLRLIMIQKRKLHRRWVNAERKKRKDALQMDLLEVGVFRRKKRRYIRKVRKYASVERDSILGEMKGNLNYSVRSKDLFTIRWELGS